MKPILIVGFATLLVTPALAQPTVLPNINGLIRVTERPGNTAGRVLVIMYHRIGDKEATMIRSRDNFRGDLERLYRLGFRPVTMKEYVSNKMALPPGASPVVFTFDDSWEDQIRLMPDGSLDPNCFMGIWKSFTREHPDFPMKATFYVLNNGPFGKKAQAAQKVKLINSWGSEIGSHTTQHGNLREMTEDQIKKDLAASIDYIRKLGVEPVSFAPPYGRYPKEARILFGFDWKGQRYGFQSAVLAGAEPAPSPQSSGFDPLFIPRVQAAEGQYMLHWWIDRLKLGKTKPYVQP